MTGGEGWFREAAAASEGWFREAAASEGWFREAAASEAAAAVDALLKELAQ